MINTDGKTTIANAGADEFLREAIDAGGHLADDVAYEILRAKVREVNDEPFFPRLAETLTSDDTALD